MRLTLQQQIYYRTFSIYLFQVFLFLFFSSGFQSKIYAQCSGDVANGKSTFSSTTPRHDGSIHPTGVPSSIVLSGNDNNNMGYNFNINNEYIITIPIIASAIFLTREVDRLLLKLAFSVIISSFII